MGKGYPCSRQRQTKKTPLPALPQQNRKGPLEQAVLDIISVT
jgi:hypothetical protein